MAIRLNQGKAPGRPRKATTALLPAAARAAEGLTPLEAHLNAEAIEVFTKAVGGRQQLADVLAVTATAPDVERLSGYLADPRYREFSLRRLCTLANITVADLFIAYRKALIAKAHIEATQVIAAKLVPVVDDVMTRATPHKSLCPKCLGTSAAGQGPCPLCQDTGVVQTEPDLDRQKLALELGQLVEKKGGIVMQQNTVAAGALVSTGSGALEQLHQAVGDLLYSPGRRRAGAPPLDGEVCETDLGEPRRDPDPPWPLPTRDDPTEPDPDDERKEPDDEGDDPEAPRRR